MCTSNTQNTWTLLIYMQMLVYQIQYMPAPNNMRTYDTKGVNTNRVKITQALIDA